MVTPADLLQAGASAHICSSVGNNSCVYTRPRASAHVFAFARLCVSIRLCMCSQTTVFPTRPPLLLCFVSFLLLLLIAGNKHWLSVSSLRSSFRSRGSGGRENVVQECQALFRKLGFCFFSLLNRSCLLFLCLGHKQAPVPFFLSFIFLHGATWNGSRDSVW